MYFFLDISIPLLLLVKIEGKKEAFRFFYEMNVKMPLNSDDDDDDFADVLHNTQPYS